jgi:hypothetical protein
MKRFTQYTIGTVFALALSSGPLAQQRDLEVTMDVVPADTSAGAAGEIKLPITLPATASPRGQEASVFGLETANKARELQGDLGREFGQAVSEAARAQDRTPNLPPQSRRP